MKTAAKPASAARKRIRISEDDITRLLKARNMTRPELASLLGVSPASLSRWVNPKNPQAPTSTTYLVLLPLLLAAGIDVLSPVDPQLVEHQISTFKGLGLLKEDELKNEKVKRSLQRAVAVLTSEDVKASRRLFQALEAAWKQVDESLMHRK